ncbi:MAG: FMN-binding protein [bacterium]
MLRARINVQAGVIRRVVSPLSVFAFSLFFAGSTAFAKGVYQSGPEFIAETFAHSSAPESPAPQSLWLTPEIKKSSGKILGRTLPGARVRYWQRDDKTAWILEEVGKELPITIGVVVNSVGIERVKILTYRESRGGEVRYPAFLEQFTGGNTNQKGRLDRHIDGITGATLSVRAVKRVAELALYFDSLVRTPADDKPAAATDD